MPSYPDMKVINDFCEELKNLSIEQLAVLSEDAKQAKATCPYPYTREVYDEIIRSCNREASARRIKEAGLQR